LRNEKGAKRLTTHGKSYSPEYKAWSDMIQRCTNPAKKNYHRYGGRGVVVCDRWLESFEAFYSDMGQSPSSAHSVGRRENGGPYSPENCKWMTRREQANNRESCRTLTFNGETKTVTEWSRAVGLSARTVLNRLKSGWSPDDALKKGRVGRHITHGMSDTPEYRCWLEMNKRCSPSATGESRKRYYEAGVQVCERWRESFAAFLADMGPIPPDKESIDRIKNEKGYEPGNCRWANRKEQNRNKRANRVIEFCGKRMCLAEWAEEVGIRAPILSARLCRGWDVATTLTTPVVAGQKVMRGKRASVADTSR
jgi:hypothetical protein